MSDIKPELIGKAARAAREAIRGREDWIASEDDWISYIVPAALDSVADDIRAEAWDEGAEAAWERSAPEVNGQTHCWRHEGEPLNPYRKAARDE